MHNCRSRRKHVICYCWWFCRKLLGSCRAHTHHQQSFLIVTTNLWEFHMLLRHYTQKHKNSLYDRPADQLSSARHKLWEISLPSSLEIYMHLKSTCRHLHILAWHFSELFPPSMTAPLSTFRKQLHLVVFPFKFSSCHVPSSPTLPMFYFKSNHHEHALRCTDEASMLSYKKV